METRIEICEPKCLNIASKRRIAKEIAKALYKRVSNDAATESIGVLRESEYDGPGNTGRIYYLTGTEIARHGEN